MSVPSEAQARDLTLAFEPHFGNCNCRVHDDHVHACAGHAWMCDDPTRRGLAKQWQRLLFMRAQRTALLQQEGVAAPSPAPEAPTRLPW